MECVKNHPFDIPEIIYSLGLFLSRDSLVKCFRVSKLWHSVLLPWLWAMPRITGQCLYRNPSPALVQENSSFIRKLSIDYKSVLRLSSSAVKFPFLTGLIIYQTVWGKPFEDPALVDFIK